MMSRYGREESARQEPDGPREGIYLDTALAVIGEQIGERVDGLERHRRRRTRLGIAALSVLTIASSSVAAVAITAAGRDADAPAAVVHTVEVDVQCVDGVDPRRPAYFATSLRVSDGTTVDAGAVCATARRELANDPTLHAESPRQLVTRAEAIVEEVAVAGPEAGDDVATVDEASFGRLSSAGGPAMTVCEGDGSALVLATPERAPALSLAERAALCAEGRG